MTLDSVATHDARSVYSAYECKSVYSVYSMAPDRILRPFHVQVTAPLGKAPVVVLVNPRSGGNQGRRVLRKMQWLLNPWQVWDITHTPPEFVIEVFAKVPHARLLVAGGDGTVGWILSTLDKLRV
jgi:diacylglycerol kinase (ATP)